jgi:hypothetical protein
MDTSGRLQVPMAVSCMSSRKQAAPQLMRSAALQLATDAGVRSPSTSQVSPQSNSRPGTPATACAPGSGRRSAGGQVQCGDHGPDPPAGVVCRPQPRRAPGRLPAAAGAEAAGSAARIHRADDPPVGGQVIVEVRQAAHLGSEVRVSGGFPGLGGLPADPTGA